MIIKATINDHQRALFLSIRIKRIEINRDEIVIWFNEIRFKWRIARQSAQSDADCTKLSARECSASDSRNDRSGRIYSPANTSINHLDRTREKFLGKTKEPSVWSWTSKNRSDLPPSSLVYDDSVFFSLKLYLKKNEKKARISSYRGRDNSAQT